MPESIMATYSGGHFSPVPHTRIEDELQMEEVYLIGKKLGEGSFGIVRKVIHKVTNIPWACKAVNKEKVGFYIFPQCLKPPYLRSLFFLNLFH